MGFALNRFPRTRLNSGSLVGSFVMAKPVPPELALVHQLIGQIATEWTEIEGLWYLIFTSLMPGARRDQIDAIFFLFESSRSQRHLVMTVADVLYPPSKYGRIHPKRRVLGQLNSRSQDLAGWRNAAIHGNLTEAYADHTMQQLTPRIAPGSNKNKRNKLAGKDLTVELKRIAVEINGVIKDLKDFLDTISPNMAISRELQKAIDLYSRQVQALKAIGPFLPTGSKVLRFPPRPFRA